MLAKLISLLIHAKSGAISGVFLLGATGALVSVSAANGVTTVTITEASPSPSASASPSASPTASSRTASPSPAASPSLSSNTSPSTAACTDEATALAFQVKRVDTAFTGFHTDLMALRGVREQATVEKADAVLRLVRHAATKAIHATATVACVKSDDEDENDVDEEGDNDGEHENDHRSSPKTLDTAAPATALSVVKETNNDKENDGRGQKLGVTFTGTATAIADQAIAAMQVAFDTAKNAPVKTPKASPAAHTDSTKGAKVSPTKGPERLDQKGKHD
jgi:hypothetical protein